MIDRDFEAMMDEHERKSGRKREAPTAHEQEIGRASLYALVLKQLGVSPAEIRERVSARYPRAKQLLNEVCQP